MHGEAGSAGDGIRRRAAGTELKSADVRAELAMHEGNLGVDGRGAVWPTTTIKDCKGKASHSAKVWPNG